jgi:clan AA aspartic protease
MIKGIVKRFEGRVRLTVIGFRGLEQEIEAVIDTGFTAVLTLPLAVISALRLRWQTVERFTLADGSEAYLDVYEAMVLWDGRRRSILVHEVEADALIGMKLLKGHELRMQICYRGKVVITRLP